MAIRSLPLPELRDSAGRFARPSRRLCAADELFVMWSAARAEANLAYDCWCAAHSSEAFAVYRAAEDRADAAQDALARACS